MLKIFKAGKLLKIEIEVVNNSISKLKIYGDFFLHPEEGIEIIEENLLGCSYDFNIIKQKIDTILKQNNIQAVGIDSSSLAEAITS